MKVLALMGSWLGAKRVSVVEVKQLLMRVAQDWPEARWQHAPYTVFHPPWTDTVAGNQESLLALGWKQDQLMYAQ